MIITIENPATGEKCVQEIDDSQAKVQVVVGGRTDTLFFEHLGNYCANRRLNLTIQQGDYDGVEDALDGRR